MNRWMLTGVAVTALTIAGCSDYRLNQMVAKYREQCFGSITNKCVEMRVEVNIAFAEEYLDRIESDRDRIIAEMGEDGYEELEKQTRNIIALNEKDLPGWLTRWFAGEAQSIKAPYFDFGYGLFIGQDYQSLYDSIYNHYQVAERATNEKQNTKNSNHNLTAAIVSNPDQGDKTHGRARSQINIINEHITKHAEELGASEYTEARLIEEGDFDEDGHSDLAIVYTLEGVGGGNNSHQVLIVISGNNGTNEVTDEIALKGAITELASDAGQLMATSLYHAQGDPSCCPSLKEVQIFRLSDGKLEAQQ